MFLIASFLVERVIWYACRRYPAHTRAVPYSSHHAHTRAVGLCVSVCCVRLFRLGRALMNNCPGQIVPCGGCSSLSCVEVGWVSGSGPSVLQSNVK